MSGSGGGPWRETSPDKLAQQIREAEQEELDKSYETEVNNLLAKLLTGYNDRDVDAISRILDKIIEDFGDMVEDSVELVFGGSVSKHTYVDGFSDIDALVCLNQERFKDTTPEELRRFLGTILKERYGEDKVTVGNLAVTVETQGFTIQLLPALRMEEGCKISSNNGKDWSRIHPERFADTLTQSNKENGGKVIPTIKLAKAIITTLPPQQQLTGYHVEALAVQIFKQYTGAKTPKAMLEYFFNQAGSFVRKPIVDTTGQSVHVDEYLGPENSTSRRSISLSLDRISRRMKNADGMHSTDQWNTLLGQE